MAKRGAQPRNTNARHFRVMNDYFAKDPLTGCWNWTKTLFSNGYAVWFDGHKQTLAHRFLWERLNGKIPKGMTLDHLCRNRKCVNPDHLEIVTRGENVRRGLLAKLNWDKVGEIREKLFRGVSRKELAMEYNVSYYCIQDIDIGRRWFP
jgi:hypothetical protein